MKLRNPYNPAARKNRWHLCFAWLPTILDYDSCGKKLSQNSAFLGAWLERYWRKSRDGDSTRPWVTREFDPKLKGLGLVDVQVEDEKHRDTCYCYDCMTRRSTALLAGTSLAP